MAGGEQVASAGGEVSSREKEREEEMGYKEEPREVRDGTYMHASGC